MDFDSRLELDGKNLRLLLQGSCLELLPLCQAACCRHRWHISITTQEYESGRYRAERTCSLTEKECERDLDPCMNRTYQLVKKPDGSCVYLGSDNLCTIYEQRPQVCRDFTCAGGWSLNAVVPVQGQTIGAPTLTEETFIERLRDEMIFVLHPLTILHTVFHVREKEEVIFVKEMVGRCGKFHTRDRLACPQLTDDLLVALIHSFASKAPLRTIYQQFCESHPIGLTKREFYQIIWLLNKHNIILEIRNFNGMLGAMGGI